MLWIGSLNSYVGDIIMIKLSGKSIGDVLVEYYGPVAGRNYNTTGVAVPTAPTIEVQVTGTGSVQVMQTNTRINKGNNGNNVFTVDSIGDPATYVAVGGVISGPAIVSVSPTVGLTFSSIRVVVTGAGTGTVNVQSIWH